MTLDECEIDKLMHIHQNKDNLPTRDEDIPLSWDFTEFIKYLYSDGNGIFEKNVEQDMTQPLSMYWINSSHNTYLKGSQMDFSKGSVEGYEQALRMGV